MAKRFCFFPPPTRGYPTHKEVKVSAPLWGGFVHQFTGVLHAKPPQLNELQLPSAVTLMPRNRRIFEAIFSLVLPFVKVNGQAKTHGKSRYVLLAALTCVDLLEESLWLPLKLKSRGSFMDTAPTSGYSDPRCSPALPFKSVTDGEGIQCKSMGQPKRIPFFVVHFQAALNDRYFTYNEELTLPWSSERHHLFKSPSLIS